MIPKTSTPSLRRHKATGQAVVTLNGRDHYLGVWLAADKKPPLAVQNVYDALLAQWLAAGRRPLSEIVASVSVSELILQFWERHVAEHYRHADGTATSEQDNFKHSLRPLRKLFGSLPAGEISPLKLKAVRQVMIDSGLSRGVINQRIGRMKRMFKWAVAEELIPETVYRALGTVEGLKAGRSSATETEPVEPVSDDHVESVLSHLSSPVRAMVRLQRLTGMRPGEVARMCGSAIDTTGEVWLYRPKQHKTSHRGKLRVIALGPQSREIVAAFLKMDPETFLFSPVVAREERFAAMRAARKTKVQPSQVRRRKSSPKRGPKAFYTRHSYAAAIAKACIKAGIPHWHPNQLRHSRATEVRQTHGLEAAQVVLGHARANVTEVYAERNQRLALEVAAQSG